MEKKLFFKSFFVLLLFFVVEVYIWSGFLKGEISVSTTLILHSVVTLILISFVSLFRWLGWGMRFITITALLTGTMGAFGAALSLVVLVLYFIYYALVDKVGELLRVLMPRIRIRKSQEIYERILYGLDSYDMDTDPTPMKDIMEFGSTEQKLEAIGVILKYYRPEFIPAIQMGLVDKSNAVRVLSATAISSIEKRMHDQYVVLKKKYEKNPNNPFHVLELAKLTRDESHASFFDPAHQKKLQMQALEYYREYLKLQPDDTTVQFQFADLLFETKQYGQALEELKPLVKKSETFTPDVYLLVMKVLFAERKYSEMHKITRENEFHLREFITDESGIAFEEILLAWGENMPQEVYA